jgi:hypothetical protein
LSLKQLTPAMNLDYGGLALAFAGATIDWRRRAVTVLGSRICAARDCVSTPLTALAHEPQLAS